MSDGLFLRMQHGIVGGFVPATPQHIVELSSSTASGPFLIKTFVKQKGSKGFDEAHSQLSADVVKSSGVLDIVDKLKGLPTEEPQGSEDIYGMDHQIFFANNGFQWVNGSPEGCSSQPSSVKPTEEQKKTFAEIVDKVKALGAKAQSP